MILVVPTPTMLTVPPDVTVATAVLELEYVTANVDDAVAVRANGTSDVYFVDNAANVMVFAFLAINCCLK